MTVKGVWNIWSIWEYRNDRGVNRRCKKLFSPVTKCKKSLYRICIYNSLIPVFDFLSSRSCLFNLLIPVFGFLFLYRLFLEYRSL